MAYVLPTIEEMHELLVAMVKGLFPTMDTSRASFAALFSKVLAAAATDNHAHINSVGKDLFPWSATDDALDAWGELRNLPRKGATGARKSAALRLVNNSGTDETIVNGTELVHSSGLRFAIGGDTLVYAGDHTDADVYAVDTGAATRLDAGEVLTFVTPPTYVEEAAELQLALDEDGRDQEQDGAYQLRLWDNFRTPPAGGAQSDYEAWAKEQTGVDKAYVYPGRAGLGTVDVAALHEGTGSARLLGPSELSTLQDFLETKIPAQVTVRAITVAEQSVDVELLILDTGEAQYKWDWVDPVAAPIVSTWTSATNTLVFTADLPSTLVPGSRFVLKKADGTGEGEILRVNYLSGTTGLVLETAPTVAPVAGDVIYAGGDLTKPVRDAIIDHIYGLGTANPDDNPYGNWQAALRLSNIYSVATAVPGVKDLTISAPADNVEPSDPAYPDDGTIYILTPGRILVRRLQ